jgi:hypothetical protein
MSKNTDLSELINYVKGITSGRLTFPFYTSTTSFTGTVAGYLGFDSSGNILTTTSPATQWTTSGSNIYYTTGNVGVGLTSPAYKIDVNGDINITGAFRINGVAIGTGGGGGVSGAGTTNFITKWSSSTSLTNSVIFDDGTSVSVGSSTAMYKFTVQPFTNINFGIGRTTLFAPDDTIFMNAVNNSFIAIPMAINTGHLGIYIGFSEAMRINSSKIVMIGTSTGITGGGLLQVAGDVNISGQFKINGVPIGSGGGGGGNVFAGSQTTNYVTKWTGSNFIGNSSIFDNGSIVGVGTTGITGGGAFQVAGDVNITGTFRVNGTAIGTGGGGVSGAGTTNRLAMWSSSTSLTDSGIYQTTYSGNNVIGFQPSGASGEVMRIENNGRVYIGASTAANASLALNIHVNSNGNLVTQLGSTSFYAFARLMHNETNFKGIGFGYDSSVQAGFIYGTAPSLSFNSTIKFVVAKSSTASWVEAMAIKHNTINTTILPTSSSGLITGDLYRDGSGYVRIV